MTPSSSSVLDDSPPFDPPFRDMEGVGKLPSLDPGPPVVKMFHFCSCHGIFSPNKPQSTGTLSGHISVRMRSGHLINYFLK